MIRLILNIHPVPKPCGRLMRGRIVMNPVKVLPDGTNYGTWKNNAGYLAQNQIAAKGRQTPLTPYGIIYQVFCPPAKKDLSNCFESVQDALVEAGIIPDDSIKYLTKISAFYWHSKVGKYDIALCETPQEWLKILSILSVL